MGGFAVRTDWRRTTALLPAVLLPAVLLPAVLLPAVLLAALVLGGCSRPSSVPAGETASAPTVAARVVAVRRETVTPVLETYGSISWRSKADISTAVDGTVKKLPVDEGSHVRPGQVIAELDNVQLEIRRTQAQSQLQAAKAAVEVARADLWEGCRQVEARLLSLDKGRMAIDQKKRERDELRATLDSREALFKVDGISEEQLQSLRLQFQSADTAWQELLAEQAITSIGLRDKDLTAAGFAAPAKDADRTSLLVTLNTQTLQARLDAALAGVQAAEGELRAAAALAAELTVTAPVTGIIGARQASIGERLRAGDKLFTIIDDAQVYAVFPVAENRAAALGEGMPVTIEVPSLGGRTLRAAVSLVSPVLDPQSGTLTARSLLPNTGGALRPGLFIRVKVQTGAARAALLVPATAVVGRSGAQGTAWVVRGGRAFRRAVVLRAEGDGVPEGSVEVETGLSAGEQVVDDPPPVLQEGAVVRASS
jgi:RND family efflux transporter MFP subunit